MKPDILDAKDSNGRPVIAKRWKTRKNAEVFVRRVEGAYPYTCWKCGYWVLRPYEIPMPDGSEMCQPCRKRHDYVSPPSKSPARADNQYHGGYTE